MGESIPASSLMPAPDNALAHYGVKGMKWGVRRSSTGGGKSPASQDFKVAKSTQAKIKKSGVKSVSNQELKTLIERKNLEKQYKDLLKNENKSKLERGNAEVQKLLKYSKTMNEVYKFLQTPAGRKVKTGFKVAGMAAKVGAAYASGGTSAAAGAAGTIAVRRLQNHYTNVGR